MPMPDWNWNAVGAITGVIGAITGIPGAVLGYLGYRSGKQLKLLDLRLELRRAENAFRSALQDLTKQMTRASDSRKRVASATGQLNSGYMARWQAELDADSATVASLNSELPASIDDSGYSALSAAELETRLIAVHARQLTATALREKYGESLAQDDKQREHLWEEQREAMQRKRMQPPLVPLRPFDEKKKYPTAEG